jgi:hypothetical protein
MGALHFGTTSPSPRVPFLGRISDPARLKAEEVTLDYATGESYEIFWA